MSNFFVQIPTVTAKELANIENSIAAVKDSFIEKRPLTVEQWLDVSRALVMAQSSCRLALKAQEEIEQAMQAKRVVEQ